MADSDSEVEKPPERRAPSSRGSKGNRMAALIRDEVDKMQEDTADKEFYTQEFWAEDEDDADFADADDEAARDSFDSDFGDSSESGSDEDEDEKPAKREKPARKKSVYKDPKASSKDAAEAGSSNTAAEAKPKAARSKRKSRTEAQTLLAEGGAGIMRESMRASTKSATEMAIEKRKLAEEIQKRRAENASKASPCRPRVPCAERSCLAI